MNGNIEKLKNSRLEAKHIVLLWFNLGTVSLVIMVLSICFGYWYLLLPYFAYIYMDPRSQNGAKTSNLHRNNFLLNIIRDYFDMKIIKTCDIPATKNYIFCYHPHGIIPFGMGIGLNSNCCGFDDLYPNINVNIKVHSIFLTSPLLREVCLYFGSQPATRESIIKTLNEPGNSVGLSIGGAAEIVYSVPNAAKLIIKNRFGFVRIALETGADLVPVYSFGENDTYNQHPIDQSSKFYRVNKAFYKRTNAVFPKLSGRGILPNTKGIFPNNAPIRIVVGKPIKVEKNPNPTDEQIRDLHDKYCSELIALYNEYKDEFWYDANSSPPKLELLLNPLK
ncbi:diacylglycerol acyltransferase [Conidiobolus coronatus NRRL 28638]|uniref:Diacylglycerol O-acyltransferase n=1 Tax=Conidiobolus coronatus (strain ATCC 28846 / CBS 209.66 / NRRL 28638) TaxID=796925 RepID=A0A137NPE9_CONC2|nr:diacylglycerol acyltransferase [Conidiobolus coronatus NRRL 28638]|eukprot:KXN64613.1 diacylglycerol acyltransferase [Conidiobolus coronatus NRRL 28638]